MVIGFRNISLRRTCAAALAAVPHRHIGGVLAGSRSADGLPAFLPVTASFLAGDPRAGAAVTAAAHQSLRRVRLFSSSSSNASSSSFQPAAPPGTHGTPVFSNIDVSSSTATSSIVSDAARLRNSSPDAVFVVSGANRGIGLQFTKSLLERTQGRIVACCRRPEEADELKQLQSSQQHAGNRISILCLDVADQASIEAAGAEIRGNFDRVDLLLNVAGILGDAKTTPGPERALAQMDRAWFEQTLAVNLMGPVMLTKELLPLLQQKRQTRKKKDDNNTATRPPAVVAMLSARVGSISDNQLGGWYSYRISKAALNQATRTLALELKRHAAWALALHPGTTDTGLSAPFSANVKEGSLFPVEFTVTQLLNVIDAMEEEHSGGLYDWAGQALSF